MNFLLKNLFAYTRTPSDLYRRSSCCRNTHIPYSINSSLQYYPARRSYSSQPPWELRCDSAVWPGGNRMHPPGRTDQSSWANTPYGTWPFRYYSRDAMPDERTVYPPHCKHLHSYRYADTSPECRHTPGTYIAPHIRSRNSDACSACGRAAPSRSGIYTGDRHVVSNVS